MNTWYHYRAAWERAPWLLAFGVLGVLMVVAGVIGTVLLNFLAFVFVPGLLAVLAHHFLAMRVLER